ncbi:hypothetical protein [uncultured Polaribacter sp.]|uniref:hypothetical protein n=1 Tax=uncultured Polaribacter sp. TaxID=174711 RepID=UPI00260B59B5|nr:hypothetical protein [uncultured Polaribacter sp.]
MNSKLETYTRDNYPEKIFIHTDKTFYTPDSQIWYSTYLVNGISHTKSKKSTVVYVELISSKDSILNKKMHYISDINDAGDFKLPKNIKPGKYYLRGYTNYMRNTNSLHFFKKEIFVLATDSIAPDVKQKSTEQLRQKESISQKPILKFYPEGGYIVQGLPNRIAIQLPEKVFNDTAVVVHIKNKNKEVLSTFKTRKFGLGEFYLVPLENETYVAEVDIYGKKYQYLLPKILPKGYIINVVNKPNGVYINLQSNTNSVLKNSTLVIHQRGKPIYSKQIKERINTKTLKIPVSELDSGVLSVTLFNSHNLPVCERLIYIENSKKGIDVAITTPKDYYCSRRKVNLSINIIDFQKENVPSNFSLAVKDKKSDPNYSIAESIKTWLLLNSDLKGHIKNPNYFFEDSKDLLRKYLLDLVMLTNGWRRFTWQEILNNENKKFEFLPETGIVILGKTLEMKSPYAPKSLPTRLTFLGKEIIQEPVQISDEKGRFKYGPYVFFDSIPILIESRLTNFKSKKNKDRNVLITTEKEKRSPDFFLKNDSIYSGIDINPFIKKYLEHEKYIREIDSIFKSRDNILDEILITAKLDDPETIRENEMNSRASYGSTFNRYDIEKDYDFADPNIYNLFYEMPRVNVEDDTLYVGLGSNSKALILLDERQIEIAELQSLTVGDISFIDVLLGPDALMFSSSGPVISIYTRRFGSSVSSTRNIKRKPGIVDFNAIGFYTAKEFYKTDHKDGLEEKTKPDTRTTLHWEPKLKSDATGNVNLSFFTSDIKNEYVIEIQGITNTGIPFFKTTSIYVK